MFNSHFLIPNISSMGFGTLTCASYCFDFVQVNSEDKFHLVMDDIPRNLLTPLVSTIHSNIPLWNKRVDDYIASIFYFAEKLLAIDGAILLFQPYDLRILNEVKSYFK
jgi:hypothetical protein